MFLVRARFELRDESSYPGFITPASEPEDLKTQQPQVFVCGRRYSFWGGLIGIPAEDQQALCQAIGKSPDEIFPLRFSADPGLAKGVVAGQIDGFYRTTGKSVEVQRPEDLPKNLPVCANASVRTNFFKMFARGNQGYPQPEGDYKNLTYEEACQRCGIYARQTAPFQLKKSGRSTVTFSQLNWVFDAFFVHPDIASEIAKAGIRGISFGTALDLRTAAEIPDRAQLVISTIIPCVDVSQLSRVTCRPENEEQTRLRAKGYEGLVVRTEQMLAGVPHCGRVMYNVPSSLSIEAEAIRDAPDVFQTAEWFGSGGLAYRLTLASARFVELVRRRGWKGLEFRATQGK
jgi:hypothetical protein